MTFRPLLMTALLAALAFAGCLDDSETDDAPADAGANTMAPLHAHPDYNFGTMTDTYGWAVPEHRGLPESITGLEEVHGTIAGISGADGIAVYGHLAFVGPRTGPLHVVDILDPMNPQVLSVTEDVPVRDAATIAFPDGRLIVITTAGSGELTATDVTDPSAPVVASVFPTPHNNHNVGVVPGTPIVYNFPSGGAYTDIIDYSDPENPVVVQEWNNGIGCHDATWYMNQDEGKYRGYCAGSGAIQIWDLTDVKAPSVIVEVPYPSPEKGLPAGDESPLPSLAGAPLSISHLAMVNHDASILILGDETGGGGINGCDTYQDSPAGPVSGPYGNLWFYDLSDETNPVLRSHLSPEAYDDPTDPTGSCTSHFGQVIEDTGFLAMSFYTSGILLIDMNNVDHPVIVDRYAPAGSDFWDVWYHQGYLFTGDIPNGMQVLGLV